MGEHQPATFGQRIRTRRRELRLSQRALAVAVGVSQEWVSKVETGVTRAPRADTVIRLAAVLRLEPTDLLAALDPVARAPLLPPPVTNFDDAARLRSKVAEWLRIKARHDPWWSERYGVLLTHLALDAERSTLLVRLFAEQAPLPEPPPWDDPPTG